MSSYDSNKMEEYQMILLKNPRSPVFAALAEAYRKMGLLEEALEVTTKGIKHNPEFVSGLVAHSKALYELKDYRQAIKFLQKASALKPENILALRLLGHCFLKLRKQSDALKSFKKLLVINPEDEAALSFVKKWEFLSNQSPSDDSENLQIDNLDEWVNELPSSSQVIHLIDSFLQYGDKESATQALQAALLKWPDNQELQQREKMLLPEPENIPTAPAQENSALKTIQLKKEFYQRWLQRIEQRKTVDPN